MYDSTDGVGGARSGSCSAFQRHSSVLGPGLTSSSMYATSHRRCSPSSSLLKNVLASQCLGPEVVPPRLIRDSSLPGKFSLRFANPEGVLKISGRVERDLAGVLVEGEGSGAGVVRWIGWRLMYVCI